MIILLGIPGAGKTTVLNELLKQLPEFRVVNWGDRMLELAKARGLVANRDEMRKLPLEKMAPLQSEAAESFARETGKWILDTHCSVRTQNGYFPGLPFRLLGKMQVEKLVLLEAPAGDILARRNSDATRLRDAQGIGEIEEHLFANKSLACAYSAFTGAQLSFVSNGNGKLADAVAKLKKIVES